jgi:hypothetical protein
VGTFFYADRATLAFASVTGIHGTWPTPPGGSLGGIARRIPAGGWREAPGSIDQHELTVLDALDVALKAELLDWLEHRRDAACVAR